MHEHFHQLQSAKPGYWHEVEGAELHRHSLSRPRVTCAVVSGCTAPGALGMASTPDGPPGRNPWGCRVGQFVAHLSAYGQVRGQPSMLLLEPQRLMASQRDRPATPDRVLVERMRSGDEPSLGELYDRHGGAAYSNAILIVGDWSDSEEDMSVAFWQQRRASRHFNPAHITVHS